MVNYLYERFSVNKVFVSPCSRYFDLFEQRDITKAELMEYLESIESDMMGKTN